MATSIYLLFLTNRTFWSKGLTYFAGHELKLVALGVGLLALHVAALTFVAVKYVIKPVYIFAILVAAAASYYVDTLGVLITRDMIQNMVETTLNEARHLVTWSFLLHMALFGLLPSVLIVLVRIDHRPLQRDVARSGLLIAFCAALAGAVTFLNYPSFASTFRERGDLMESLNPAAPIVSAVKFGRRALRGRNVVARPIGEDAHRGQVARGAKKPMVTVVIAGETARAASLAYYGYSRDTNPYTRALGAIAFMNTTSCGTATAISLPCMFSVYGRNDYSDYKGRATQGLLDVLRTAGVETSWWDANTGSKGIAARTEELSFAAGDDPRFCIEGECRDDILVDKLKQELALVNKDTVFTLHLIGSHGPAYFLRYPQDFAPFKPDCRTAEFANCSRQEIVNAYDNTIAYTDKILADIIALLQANADRVTGAMIYMSDHGESVGENGLYLHGAPYMFAPNEQIHVPFITWLSDDYSVLMNIDDQCLRRRAAKGGFSHDNLFHTVLGMMDVQTSVYDETLDTFAPCRARSNRVGIDASPTAAIATQ